jgi:phenylalanyl-tRNA synthetase beta chain
MVIPALDRCAALIAELAGGSVRPGVVDCVAQPAAQPSVRLRWSRPAELLGMAFSREESRTILLGLGFRELAADDAGATFAVPSWRVDVSIEEDLVEELVRTRGYDAIPETLPPTAVSTPVEPLEAQLVSRLREALEAAGFSEAVNFSFVAAPDLAPLRHQVATGDGSARALGIALQNPISAELSLMRTSLVPSLLRNAARNRAQRVDDVRLYELARAYRPAPLDAPGDAPSLEDLRVAGVLLGRRAPAGWTGGAEPVDFYDAKAAVGAVLAALDVGAVRWQAGGESWLHPRVAATVLAPGGEVLGWVGELHPRVATAFDLPRGVLAFELSVEALARHGALVPRYHVIPSLPAVLRDLAVVVAEPVTAEAVLSAVRQEPLVDDATLFDVYRGAPIPAGKKNLALAIRYRAADRTLTDAEAEAAHQRIVSRLAQLLGAELRG